MKIIKQFVLEFIIILMIYSCGNPSNSASIDKKSYPYEEISNKFEDPDWIYLFTSSRSLNIDTLTLFCKDKKRSYTDGVLHVIVFFDSKENAKFPNNPISALYSDETDLKHIRAIYEFNKLNSYSKLTFYEKNGFEGPFKVIEI